MLSSFVERGVGLDVHKKTIVACALVGPGNAPRVVKRRFGTFAADLRQLREWIVALGCTHVLMESTGVYWWPVYRTLEEAVTVIVGNAWHLRRVPGRKTDMSDAHWLAVLLRMGLVEPSFIPPRPIRALRELTRYRRKLVQDRTAAQARVDKLLEIAGIKLSSVASDVFGVSGCQMLAAMAGGTKDPDILAELARGRLRVKKAELKLAFEPSLSVEARQLLHTELKHVHRLNATLAELELHLDQQLQPYAAELALLDSCCGINAAIAADVLAEIGPDLTPWRDAEHLCSWAGLAPGNNETGGKKRPASTRKGNPYLKSILVQAALSAVKKNGSFVQGKYRSLCRRRGHKRAVVAIARELLVSIYHMLERKEPYREYGVERAEQQDRERVKNKLIKKLTHLGWEVHLSPITTA